MYPRIHQHNQLRSFFSVAAPTNHFTSVVGARLSAPGAVTDSTCPTGFTGSSCELCAAGFFGPKCQSCPSNCAKCDKGITGTGVCLTPTITNPPSSCNCLNGVYGSNGQCTCNPSWTTGTSCLACSTGFFQTDDGNCKGWFLSLTPNSLQLIHIFSLSAWLYRVCRGNGGMHHLPNWLPCLPSKKNCSQGGVQYQLSVH